jgi:hypothetical protein
LSIEADCAVGTGDRSPFCAQYPPNIPLTVCPTGHQQVAYDKCCSTANPSVCQYANGSFA